MCDFGQMGASLQTRRLALLRLQTRLFPLRDSAARIHKALSLVLGKSSLRCTRIFSIPAVCLAAACRVMGGSELAP